MALPIDPRIALRGISAYRNASTEGSGTDKLDAVAQPTWSGGWTFCGWARRDFTTSGNWNTLFGINLNTSVSAGLLFDYPGTSTLSIEYGTASGWQVDAFASDPGRDRPYFWAVSSTGLSIGSTVAYWGRQGAPLVSRANTVALDSFVSSPANVSLLNDVWNQSFPGRMWNVMGWARGLSVADLTRQMNNPAAPVTGGLWAWWPLEGDENQLVRDYSGNRRNLTRTGTGQAGRIFVPASYYSRARSSVGKAPAGGSTPKSATFSLDLAVQIAQSVTASMGVAVQAPRSATTSINLAVQQALTAQASLDTAVQLARNAAASLDTAVQAAGSVATGTSVAVQASASAALAADLAVQQARTATASVDAYVQAATQLAASIDVLVQDGHSLSVALSMAVQAARTGTSTVDLAVQFARSAAAGVDVAVQQARSAAASVNLAVQAAVTAGASVDLYVQAGFAAVTGLDLAVRIAASAATAVDLAVATARSASVQIGAAVSVQQVLTAAMQAAVRASAAASCSVGLYVDDPGALVNSAPPIVPRVQVSERRTALQTATRGAARQRARR